MDLQTALGVEHKRREAEEGVASALRTATELEAAEAAGAEVAEGQQGERRHDSP